MHTSAGETATDRFGLFGRRYWDDPHGIGALAREQAAVHPARLPSGVRVWVVTRHAEARAALADPRLIKAATHVRAAVVAQLTAAGHDPAAASIMFAPHMLFADGADHARLRRLVGDVLTRRRMDAMAPAVQARAAALVAALPTAAPVDLVAEIALPLPLTVICDLVGIPDTDRPALRAWTDALMEEDPDAVVPASASMARYVAALVEAKRATPGDDLTSALVTAGDADDRLTPDELVGTVVLIIVAGHETTANAIGNGAAALLSEPARWRALADDPAAIPAAVEELLRLDGGVRHGTYRLTAEPVTIGETVIPAGELVLVSLISADRDPAAFDRPTEYRPGRPGQHLAFGHGPHYCLGAPLARVEVAAALRHLTAHHPRARLAEPAAPPAYTRSPVTIGRRRLPVILNP